MIDKPNSITPGESCESAADTRLDAVYHANWTATGLAGPDGGANTETHWYKLAVDSGRSFLIQIQYDQQVEIGWHRGCGDDSPLTDWFGPINFDGDLHEKQWPIQATFFTDEFRGSLAIGLASEKPGSYQFKLVIA